MEVTAIRLPRIEQENSLKAAMGQALSQQLRPEPGDILVVTSKVVAVDEGRVVNLASVRPNAHAVRLAQKARLDPAFVRVVMKEADKVLGAVPGAVLTLKDGMFVANSGADRSNAPEGHAVLWPANAWATAERLRVWFEALAGGPSGIVIADSHCEPLRLGTSGVALACAGFLPVEDVRGQADLYGHEMRITFRAVADAVASAAVLQMGEVAESTPCAIVRGSGLPMLGRRLTAQERRSPNIAPDKDLFAPAYRHHVTHVARRGAR